MGKNSAEIVAVVIAVMVVFAGIAAGLGGFMIQEPSSGYADAFAQKTGTTLTTVTAPIDYDVDQIAVFETPNGIYINAISLLNAYRGNADSVVVYNVVNGTIVGEQTAPITFNHAAGILNSGAGQMLINFATAANT
ncbi:hypothetical protein [Methanorbis furvi]|uniref:Uncharacterized protein n=1 Tax=Methanorbis furvi TaxID=3028299 RepID=A0AAE4M9S2_9EURY|nr:hypothetical protein [Methanocorpusculaceae archaeon Ag1]